MATQPVYSDRRLKQIWLNGQRTLKARPLGWWVRRVVDDRVRGLAARREILTLVAEATSRSEDFQTHCSMGTFSGGKLTVMVDDPRWIHALRVRWLYPLLQHLRKQARHSFVERLEFRLGQSDTRFGSEARSDGNGEE